MAEAHEVQCPNCGSNDCIQQPNSPALFRCAYCRSLFSPPIDLRRQPPPAAPAQPAQAQSQSTGPWQGVLSRSAANRYLLVGFVVFFLGCAPGAPIVWYIGYREARSRGEDASGLMAMSLLFGIPMILFGLFVLLALLLKGAH